MPGVRVFINNHTSPIIIGGTGIYELNIDGLSNITDLSFDPASLNLINSNDNANLIIDFIYEGEG
uniref:IPP transferase n=1 Tax=Siphoviridae sp. ctxMM9 TaxID=2827973 RepID=A0A8S5T7M9_9CAUD|nr:MAG TPA: IPP transferase [Siphoviridae sp. ctxMM9]